MHCPLAGGDTVATPGPLTLSVTAFGAVPSGRMVLRSGVRPGDRIYVTGTIGDAAIGLLESGRAAAPTSRKAEKELPARPIPRTPQPRVALAKAMSAHAARRHGRFRRLCRRPDQDARGLGRQRPRADLSPAAVARRRAPRSPPSRTCSWLPRPAATTMNSSPRSRRIRARFRGRGRRGGRSGRLCRRGDRWLRCAALRRT